MTPDFEISELREFLERGLGFRLSSLRQLPVCNQSLNFKAVRASDEHAFLVKLSPTASDPGARIRQENLSRNLLVLRGTKAVGVLFPEAPAVFSRYRLLCLSWCDGRSLTVDRLSPEQFSRFLDDYLSFSSALQRVRDALPQRDLLRWRSEIQKRLRGFLGTRFLRRMEAEVPVADCTYDQSSVKVIHGDLHARNFHFAEGRVTGFFDLEELRLGYPAEDIVRYVVCSFEHLGPFALCRRARILRSFADAVRRLPFSEREWLVAVNGLFLYRIIVNVRRGCGLRTVADLFLRARLYRKLRRIFREISNPSA